MTGQNRWVFLRRAFSAAGAAAAVGSAALVAGAPPAAAELPVAAIQWQSCPTYSDEALGVRPERVAEYRALLARLECGTVSVPIDYRHPRGRQISVAVTRLPATDQAHRLGSIALNPGGPGGSGYLMPITASLANEQSARLNERYDLIGFDPRGVGYSTKVACPRLGPTTPAPGPLTEAAARQLYDSQVAASRACGLTDPAFLGQLTTLNVARDLDRIRAALGLRKISFFGASWGTWLGAVYRSTFPASTARMFLDSPASPVYSIGSVTFDDVRAAATEQNFARMAAWLAQHDGTYGFGSTGEQVRAAILALRQAYDANPKRFADMSAVADGSMVAGLASATSVSVSGRPGWEQAGQGLAALRDVTGDTAPPIIKAIFDRPPMPVVPDAPERVNETMVHAIVCNGAASRLDFEAAWAIYQRRLAANPVTGRSNPFFAGCAGWPLPVQEVWLHHGGGSLVLSGHRHEILSPYQWTAQMRATVGGTAYTVDDDVHVSVLQDSTCSADLVSYFTTGRIGPGCPGLATP